MKKTIFLILISFSSFASFNCATSILPAAIFGSAEYHVSGTPTGGPTDAKILKSGQSCNIYSLLNVFFYSGGEGSIIEAAQKAGIKKIAVVDKSVLSVFAPIFSRECVVVYGE
ncbi:TRL-like family protein [Leptospira koniambonensis]|uniref:TRL-like family protein n=1 Tax=Leptospira koniambonensis TaxID=2484950 RepID=A0A4R9J7I4_9LEPT|nr:TRL domain-containing protein [Leptospira koniambonensis]TGL33734.1 TRL-like family protein [Leptospira koniambonensis]